jgi:RNA-directed DNA polymerase
MTKHSNIGLTENTKLDRIRKRSLDYPDTVFNNLGHVISVEFLMEIYQQLDGNKAVGIDGITKKEFGENLEENIKELIHEIRRGKYRPKAARLVEIPKEDGNYRPLAISCFRDKLVQSAAAKILEQIYEPIFSESSYGGRPGRNCHQTLRSLMHHTDKYRDGAVVEIDIKKYFNSIPHEPLEAFLAKKISDRKFLRLIKTLTKSPILMDGIAVENKLGCPQGSCISGILANIYLHHVIDEWFETIKKSHFGGEAEMCRFMDDMVFVFKKPKDAEAFYRVLPKRLAKYGLLLHEEKSQILPSGQIAAERANKQGKKIGTYQFLGFTCYWGKARNGKSWRLKYKSRRDRLTSTLNRIKQFMRKHLNTPNTDELLKDVVKVIKGWVNYHAITDNQRKVWGFIKGCARIILKWYNRRGCKKAMNWDNLNLVFKRVGFPTRIKTTSMFT